MVHQLEEIYDSAPETGTPEASPEDGLELRSGDELAAEIRAFVVDAVSLR